MKSNAMTQSGPYFAQQSQSRLLPLYVDHAKREEGLRKSLQSVQSGESRKERSATAGADEVTRASRRRALTFKQLKTQQLTQVALGRKQAAAASKGKGLLQANQTLSSTLGSTAMQERLAQVAQAPQVTMGHLLLGDFPHEGASSTNFTAKRNAFRGRRTSEGAKAPSRTRQVQIGAKSCLGKQANSTTVQFYTQKPVTRGLQAPGELCREAQGSSSKLSSTAGKASQKLPLEVPDYLPHKALGGGERRLLGGHLGGPNSSQTLFSVQLVPNKATNSGGLDYSSTTAPRIPVTHKGSKGKAYGSTLSALSRRAAAAREPQNGPSDSGVYSVSRPGPRAQTAAGHQHGRGPVSSKGTTTAQRPSTGGDLHLPEPETAPVLISPSPFLEPGHSLLKANHEGDEIRTTEASKERADDGQEGHSADQGESGALPQEDSPVGYKNALGSSHASPRTTSIPPNASIPTTTKSQASPEAEVVLGTNATLGLGGDQQKPADHIGSSVPVSGDKRGMQTKVWDLIDLENSYLDSVTLQQMQGRLPVEESTISGFGSMGPPSRAQLRVSAPGPSRSRTQKPGPKGYKASNPTLQESLRHPTLTKFLAQGGVLYTSSSWQQKLQERIHASQQPCAFTATTTADFLRRDGVAEERNCRSQLQQNTRKQLNAYQEQRQAPSRGIHSAESSVRVVSDHSRNTPPLDDGSVHLELEAGTALNKARRARQRATNVRIRTGGKLHKYRDTRQQAMKRQFAEQFQRHADETRNSSKPQPQLDQTRHNHFFGTYGRAASQEHAIHDQSRTASNFTFQQLQQAADQDIRSEERIKPGYTAPQQRSPSKQKRTKKEKEVYQGIIGAEAQERHARIQFNRKLLDAAIVLPAIFAANIHDEDCEEDQKFVKGCHHMHEGQYGHAVRCFHAGQRMAARADTVQSEELSSSEQGSDGVPESRPRRPGGRETGAASARLASEGGASQHSADQNCRSIDSHMSRLRLPRYLRDLGHLEREAGTTPPLQDGSSSAVLGSSTLQLSYRQSLRQKSLFNMSVCFARCGYMDSAVQAIQMVNLPEIRTLALFNHALYLILQLPLPYVLSQQTGGGTSTGAAGKPPLTASGRQTGWTSPLPGYVAGVPLPEEYLLQTAVGKLTLAIGNLEQRASRQSEDADADPHEDGDWLKYTGFWEKCQRVVHTLGKQLQKKLDVRWEQEKEEQLQAFWDKDRQVVTRSTPAKFEAGSPASWGSGEGPSTEDLLSTVLHLSRRLMLVEFREQAATSGVPSADVLDQDVIDEITHRQRLKLERQSSAVQRLERVSASAGTNEGSASDHAHTQVSAVDGTQPAESARKHELRASTQKLPFTGGARVTNQRELDRLARKEKRRTERLVKHDWRAIEQRRVNDFEKSAQDKRIEKLVQKVSQMTSEQVEKAMNEGETEIREVGTADYEPVASKSSVGSGFLGRVTVPEEEPTAEEEGEAEQRPSAAAIGDLETGDADGEQASLFLPQQTGSGTPKSGTLLAHRTARQLSPVGGLQRGERAGAVVDSVQTARETAVGNADVSSAEAALLVPMQEGEEPDGAERASIRRLGAIKRTTDPQRADRRDWAKGEQPSRSALESAAEHSRVAASEGEHEPEEVHTKDVPQANDSAQAGLTVADADSKLYYRDLSAADMGQTRAQRLAAAFVQNTKLLAYLTYRIDYLQQSEKFKRRVDLQQQVTRLAMIRKDTSYNVAVMAFMRHQRPPGRGPFTVETEKEMKRSLKQAMSKRVDPAAYEHRLRAHQIDEILAYKRQVQRGRIADFKAAFDLLSKISWFDKYGFEAREELVNRAEIKIYEPGDLIIQQNDASPSVNVILRGSVEVSVTKVVWGHPITFTLSTFFDGQLFGEMADFESCKDHLTHKMLEQLQSQKYTCKAQEQCCVLHINKKDLNQLAHYNVAEEFQQRLDFIKAIDIFKNVSLFSLLPITNNLVRKTFKLGEVILFAGEVPLGLYLIKSGFCKVGVDRVRVKREEKEECQYAVNGERGGRGFAHGSSFRDPIRDTRRGQEHLNVANKFDPESFRGERVGAGVVRKLQSHEAEVKKLVTPDKYRARKRLFQENKYVLLDDDKQPIGDNQAGLREFLPFFNLATREHFGGRVLIAESTVTNEGKEYNAQGQPFIQPAQLSVVADSAEVEILLMEKNQVALFPEDVQLEVVSELHRAPNVERPFSDKVMEGVQTKFSEWYKQRKATVKQALQKSIPADMQTELERASAPKALEDKFKFVLE